MFSSDFRVIIRLDNRSRPIKVAEFWVPDVVAFLAVKCGYNVWELASIEAELDNTVFNIFNIHMWHLFELASVLKVIVCFVRDLVNLEFDFVVVCRFC